MHDSDAAPIRRYVSIFINGRWVMFSDHRAVVKVKP